MSSHVFISPGDPAGIGPEITLKSLKNLNETHKFVIAGGVAANKFIRSEFKKLEDTFDIKVYYPDLKYCGDNASMIAFVGSMMNAEKKGNNPSQVRARWPLDELKK